MLRFITLLLLTTSAFSFLRINSRVPSLRLTSSTSSATIPEGIAVDILEVSPGEGKYEMKEKVDLGERLKSHEKAILFAVPGAFTPTWYRYHTVY